MPALKKQLSICLALTVLLLAGCRPTPSLPPAASPTPAPSPTPPPSATATPTPTLTATPTPTSTPRPLILVFYGDSVLKVGDVSRQGEVGFSFVDVVHPQLPPSDAVFLQNHGGRTAVWAFANLTKNVLDFHPDVVTLWWGMNDLAGCPGIFDRATDHLVQYKLTALVKQYIQAMRAQIDAILAKNAAVIVMTSMPVLGTLPWSHLTDDGRLVWENDYRCDFNLGLEQLVEAQRQMVADYAAQGKPVAAVDVWQIYHDHPKADKMYMDIVHPGSQGAQLIAEGWLQVFQSFER